MSVVKDDETLREVANIAAALRGLRVEIGRVLRMAEGADVVVFDTLRLDAVACELNGAVDAIDSSLRVAG